MLKKIITAVVISFLAIILVSNLNTKKNTLNKTSQEENINNISGITSVNFTENLGALIDYSILPLTKQANGRYVRPISFVAIYQKDMSYLGHSSFHINIDAESNMPLDLSSKGLDINMDQDWTVPVEYRDLHIEIVPTNGKTWGTVESIRTDININTKI